MIVKREGLCRRLLEYRGFFVGRQEQLYLSFGYVLLRKEIQSHTTLALSLTDALLNTPTSAIAKDVITTDIPRFQDQLPTKTPRHHLQKKMSYFQTTFFKDTLRSDLPF
jgi:hypothetical protein